MITVISVTEKGNKLGEKILDSIQGVMYSKSDMESFKLQNVVGEIFYKTSAIVFISSTGIAVRAIAPFIKGKDKDPAVVVVDVSNNFTISLLSGHLGGANELTTNISEILGNTPVITTATDAMGVVAPDMIAKENGLLIEDLKKAKDIAALLVNNHIVGFKDDYLQISTPKGYFHLDYFEENMVWVTNKVKAENVDNSKILRLIKKDIILGIGCRKGTTDSKIREFVSWVLIENNIDIRAVKKIVSVDVKKYEQGIVDFSEELGCEFYAFTREEIKTVQHKYEKSEFVYKTLGVTAVCEPVVELGGGKIIIPKVKYDGMTLCVGQEQ